MRLLATMALAVALAFGGAPPALAQDGADLALVEARLRQELRRDAAAERPLVQAPRPQAQAGAPATKPANHEPWKTVALVTVGVAVVLVGGSIAVGYLMGTFPPRGE